MYRIELVENDKTQLAETILRQLPDWFGIEQSLLNYLSDISKMPTYFAVNEAGNYVGFATLHYHNTATAEIHVMGVLPTFHGQGIGTLLVNEVSQIAKSTGRSFLTVKTLGESHPDRKFYSRTREFYLGAGFLPLEESLKIWDGMPCLLLVKALNK
ncbi:MAG: GNAT family N-acetyltransferase [Candidatus Obscuribacterales bacterium]|nr:GNAT family N-acetyltransferase [Candidatus Obscuribacterales bacterium]